jgi:hypothetical protein
MHDENRNMKMGSESGCLVRNRFAGNWGEKGIGTSGLHGRYILVCSGL